jgi:adenosylcobinamide-GDP ribazoletransferase
MTERNLLPGLRLAVTTLTVLRLPAGRVDGGSARVAMMTAPAVGLALGAAAGAAGYGARLLWHSDAVAAVVVVITLAAATGLLHLDGLADTADGIGAPAGRDRLAIMKNPGIGAFGVAALALVLLTQVVALTRAFGIGVGSIAIVCAVTTSRVTLPLGCLRGVPAARANGLGATVAGTVSVAAAAVVVVISTVLIGAFAVVHDNGWGHVSRVVWSVAAGLVAGSLCHALAVRRLGGITGDVLGAGVELSTTVALLAVCIRG